MSNEMIASGLLLGLDDLCRRWYRVCGKGTLGTYCIVIQVGAHPAFLVTLCSFAEANARRHALTACQLIRLALIDSEDPRTLLEELTGWLES